MQHLSSQVNFPAPQPQPQFHKIQICDKRTRISVDDEHGHRSFADRRHTIKTLILFDLQGQLDA